MDLGAVHARAARPPATHSHSLFTQLVSARLTHTRSMTLYATTDPFAAPAHSLTEAPDAQPGPSTATYAATSSIRWKTASHGAHV